MIKNGNSNIHTIAWQCSFIANEINAMSGMLVYATDENRGVVDNKILQINEMLDNLPRQIAEISQPEPPTDD